MVPVELIVFDFDGTLVSSGEDIAASVNYALKQFQLPERDEKEILGFIGDGVDVLMKRAVGEAGAAKYAEALDIFSRYYEEHLMDRTQLYPGARAVLSHFNTKKKVIVTNKRIRFTLKILEALEILTCFEEVIGRDSHEYVKPDRRLLLAVMEKYGVSGEKTVVIGDGINDLIMAKDAGALSCAFLNGLTPREALIRYQPDFTCEKLEELKSIFS